jgi:hypothetical protein
LRVFGASTTIVDVRRILTLVAIAAVAGGCAETKSASSRHVWDPSLSRLPREGVLVEENINPRSAKQRLTFVALDGRIHARLEGAAVDSSSQPPAGTVILRHGNRLYRLDPAASRLFRDRAAPPRKVSADIPGCSVFALRGPTKFLLCGQDRPRGGSTIESVRGGTRRVIARAPRHAFAAPGDLGYWRDAVLSPDGRTVLGQWSAACESPTAFFVAATGGHLRAVTGETDLLKAPESQALGWSRAGQAVVHFFGGCGNGISRPGVYVVDPTSGARRLVYRMRIGYAMMWRS